MIWVNTAQKSRQVRINHSDITAVISQVQERMLFVVSVDIPCSSGNRETDQKNLQHRLNLIHGIYQAEKSQCSDLEIILTGDFNK